ncbi:MAG TPA: FecR family protein [Gaiellaceae bacterium]|jgi:hypothetical protein
MQLRLPILLVVVLLAGNAATARSFGAAPKLLDTVTVDATKTTGTQSSVSLNAGTAYTLEISGTVVAPGGGKYDALYCVTGSSGGTACPTRTAALSVSTAGASSYPQPDQAIDAFQKSSPNKSCTGETICANGLEYSSNHDYSVAFFPPASGKVTFGTDPQLKLHQAFFTSGAYTIKIYESAVTSGGGGKSTGAAHAVSISGEVSVRHKNGTWTPLTPGTQLQVGDELATGVDSHLLLKFEDGSTMQLNELTQIIASTLLIPAKRKDVELQLVVGAIKANVTHETTLDTSFRIRQATASAGVRGTVFTDFYDPVDKVAVIATDVDAVTVTPTRARAKPVVVPAGKEVEVTAAGVSPIAPIGKADARGGIDRVKAFQLVTAVIDRATSGCGLDEKMGATARFSVKPATRGWLVSLTVAGQAAGVTTWSVAGSKAKPVNALAKKLAGRCAGSSGADPSGNWQPANGQSGPPWVFKANGSMLTASWSGSGAHASLRGTFSGTKTGSGKWSGTFSITEGATHVTGAMTVQLTGATLVVVLTPSGGSPSTIRFARAS